MLALSRELKGTERRLAEKGREKLEAAEEEVFHGFLTEILRRLKLNRTLLEKVLSGINATDLIV